LECIQGQVKRKVHSPQLDPKGWVGIFESTPIRWAESDGEVCPNLHISFEPHSNEGRVHIENGFPSWLITLCLGHHLAKEWDPCDLSRNDEGCGMHGGRFHATKGKNVVSLATQNENEYWKHDIN
jgi:hypothetical protein